MRWAALVLALFVGACATTTIGSVGAVLVHDRETRVLRVLETPDGMAADQAGLEPGDEILMIEGHYVRDLGLKQVRAMLRGEVGSQVELTVDRRGEVRRLQVRRGALRPKQPAKKKPKDDDEDDDPVQPRTQVVREEP
jgi:C-terminal processing protease CtpA/Prc